MAALIMSMVNDNSTIKEIFHTVWGLCHQTDTIQHPTWTTVEPTDEEGRTLSPTQELEFKFTRKHLLLLQTLYYFTKLRSTRLAGFHLADIAAGNAYIEWNDKRLSSDDVYYDKDNDDNQDQPDPTNTPCQNNTTNQTSRPTRNQLTEQNNQRHNHHNDDEEDEPGLQTTSTVSSDSEMRWKRNNGLPPRIDRNSNFRFTGAPSPKEQQSTGAQTFTFNQRQNHSRSHCALRFSSIVCRRSSNSQGVVNQLS
jgi:hypothetical protein